MNINNLLPQYRDWVQNQKKWLLDYKKGISYEVVSQTSKGQINISPPSENEMLQEYDIIKVISNGDEQTVTVEVSFRCIGSSQQFIEKFVV